MGYSSWGRKQPDTSERLTLTSYIFPQAALSIPKALKGFPGGSDGKESACNMGDLGLIPGFGIAHGERNGTRVQYSSLENCMDRGAWQTTAHGFRKSWTQLSD